MISDQARTIVASFYDALNAPSSKNVRALIEGCASPEWRSFSAEGVSKSREEFIQQVTGFGKLIPDLAWVIKEILCDGDRIIVRSEASGTPAGDFMGVPHAGRRFSIMTIDIHSVVDRQLLRAHHVEDWAGALRQLKS
jgi:predicted ester cyclase